MQSKVMLIANTAGLVIFAACSAAAAGALSSRSEALYFLMMPTLAGIVALISSLRSRSLALAALGLGAAGVYIVAKERLSGIEGASESWSHGAALALAFAIIVLGCELVAARGAGSRRSLNLVAAYEVPDDPEHVKDVAAGPKAAPAAEVAIEDIMPAENAYGSHIGPYESGDRRSRKKPNLDELFSQDES